MMMEQPTEQTMMMRGLLEVMLVDAQGLLDSDTFGKMDPYVLIQYKDQKLKSPVAKGQGSNPVWNERFTLWVQYPEADDDQYNLIFKIMDKDTFSSDDFVGEAAISVKDVVELGMEKGKAEKPPCKYKVIKGTNNNACGGEIHVGFTFTRKE